MIKQGEGGKIINISSMAGSSGQMTMVGYGAAKAAVNNLTEGLAMSWAQHNIACNAVAPGLIATDHHVGAGWIPPSKDKDGNPLPKLQTVPLPSDVAAVCLFLASPAGDAVNGMVYPISADRNPVVAAHRAALR